MSTPALLLIVLVPEESTKVSRVAPTTVTCPDDAEIVVAFT